MARNCPDHPTRPDSGDEEEALSLCDLPLGYTSNEENPLSRNPEDLDPEEDEFEFGSWVRSVSTENEMCAADEVFFKGQILPLRLSSSRTGSRSESMDHSPGLTSISSRSSSLNSTTTSSSSATSNTNTMRFHEPMIRNQLQTHPSPKPQIRVSGRLRSNRRSSVWNLFRVGLVPTPEIGLQDLKVRSSNNNSGQGHNSKFGAKKDEDKRTRRDRFLDKNNSGFLRGCKCSVETVSCSVKSTTRSSSKKGSSSSGESTRRAMQQQERKKTSTAIKQRHDVSRRRTSEWLKELSHASSPDHETVALLA